MELIINGKEFFSQIKEEIDRASYKIEIQMFIWRNDDIGNEILEALLKAAKRGVKIKIIKDAYGVIFESSEENCQTLFHQKAPIKYKMIAFILKNIFYQANAKKIKRKVTMSRDEFLNMPNVSFHSGNFRNHTKYFIFDEKILFIGGINIEDKEVSSDIKLRKYHDYMVKIESKDEVNYFRERLALKKQYDDSKKIDYIINQKSHLETHHLLKMIKNAKERIYMAMAYFGNKEVRDALFEATKNNVEVKIITSDDSNVQTHYNKQILNEYVKNNIEVYFHKGLIHAKAILIDEKLVVGSINLNDAGIYKLGETSIVTTEKKLILDFLKDFNKLKEASEISNSQNLKYSKIRSFLEKVFS
ncbi:Cardiolipin synthase [Alteracholeplasma palmae J233]|uniref:Cardiolipin synthase n=1 Tax=Alteracholeplasma palmae (strain ATCC 49389 / J233) TaxID=1318466 RepID=U4KNL6_ALTPJ|nr:phosphatidylserine/phosphatidylglycerophosphate/cardiolipin synthase family protein [Alteracholeplasma palmae]CCV63790.1 Cardiolipin synthase [Alteracholeplasma palmae J233]